MSRFDDNPLSDAASLPMYRVEMTIDGERRQLYVTFLDSEKMRHDCTRWLYLDEALALEFADAFARSQISHKPLSRKVNCKELTAGFITWVTETKKPGEINIGRLTAALFREFDRWLELVNEENRFARGSKFSLIHKRGVLNQVLKQMKAGKMKSLLPVDCRMQRGALSQHQQQNNSIPPYDYEEFGKILGAIRSGVMESLRFFDQRDHLLRTGRHLLGLEEDDWQPTKNDAEISAKARLVVRLQQRFGFVLPLASDIRAAEPDLYDELMDFGIGEIYPIMHPSCGDLLPFALQIAVLTGFNARPLWNLEFGTGVQNRRAFGADRLVFTSYKSRKGAVVMASYIETDEAMSAPFIMRRVEAWTREIRIVASREIASDVWLYVPRHNAQTRGVRSMRVLDVESCNFDVNNATSSFTKRFGVSRAVPARIRATLATLAHDLFGGDIRAVMDFLQHSNPEVTLRNYTNGISVARHHEIVATIQMLQERYIRSDGTLDPRMLAQSGDPSASTPGFQCIDPFNSPQPGQKKGRMCEAYGSCPTCPHAMVHINSAVSCARVIQVKRELERAKHRVLPERWSQSLAHHYTAIENFWLPAFTPHARQHAANVHTSPILPFE